jgi:hypothetical protein
MQNATGERGETIFKELISKFDDNQPPRFRPGFLGDKWPTFDFLVELVDAPPPTPFFFVQVKATRQGFTQRKHRLNVQVSQDTIVAMADHPAPTYLAGIDVRDQKENGWLLAVTGHTRTRLPSLPTNHPIDKPNRTRLYDEVAAYWQARAPNPMLSAFVTRNWK